MSAVRIWILLGNELLLVPAQLDDSLVKLFIGLRSNPDAAEHNLAKIPYSRCKFYKLKHPVSVAMDDSEGTGEDEQRDARKEFLDQVKQACLEETNRMPVNPGRTRVRSLAEKFPDHVCFVLDLPDPFGKLVRKHGALFKCLQVTVETLGNWRYKDVERNLQGGILTNDSSDLPPEFREIQEALAKKRVYQADDQGKQDFQNAQTYQSLFDHVFAPGDADSRTVLSDREFAAFYRVLRCYHPDASSIIHNSSSSLKASNFTVYFIQPPFFDKSRRFKYYREKSWSFPIFVAPVSARNDWHKFTPRNNWMVVAHHEIPSVISEVTSREREKEKERSRMLVEAIALSRAGQFLLKSTSEQTFFVVAIFVDAKMVASRYIVMQTGRGNADHTNDLYKDKAVCIHRKDFKLDNHEEEADFLREMYNLAARITALSGELDQVKENTLTDLMDLAEEVPLLDSKTTGDIDTDSTTEGSERSDRSQDEDEDDLGIFEAEDIQNILHEMNYNIDCIPGGHPELAMIVNKAGDKHGYLKFVDREREVDVLRYLTEIESPFNHTISGVRFWPVEGGTVISMPVAGSWLTSLFKPDEQLWSVALQLVEAVAFMHEHNVAHMDIKPQNVIIPPEGGRLSIIDFSVSIRVRGPDVKYTGVIGTEGYMAPEVRKGQYKPMLADLWSCGRTLEGLCSCSISHDSLAERTKLLGIARKLVDRDPEARPSMATVLEWMAAE